MEKRGTKGKDPLIPLDDDREPPWFCGHNPGMGGPVVGWGRDGGAGTGAAWWPGEPPALELSLLALLLRCAVR